MTSTIQSRSDKNSTAIYFENMQHCYQLRVSTTYPGSKLSMDLTFPDRFYCVSVYTSWRVNLNIYVRRHKTLKKNVDSKTCLPSSSRGRVVCTLPSSAENLPLFCSVRRSWSLLEMQRSSCTRRQWTSFRTDVKSTSPTTPAAPSTQNGK